MNSKPTKVILVKNAQYGWYKRDNPYMPPDDELLILEDYFGSGLGNDPSQASSIKNLILRDIIGSDLIGSEIIDGKIRLYHLFINNLKEPQLTKEELLKLVDKWFELVTAKANKIVIMNDNGKFSIVTE